MWRDVSPTMRCVDFCSVQSTITIHRLLPAPTFQTRTPHDPPETRVLPGTALSPVTRAAKTPSHASGWALRSSDSASCVPSETSRVSSCFLCLLKGALLLLFRDSLAPVSACVSVRLTFRRPLGFRLRRVTPAERTQPQATDILSASQPFSYVHSLVD